MDDLERMIQEADKFSKSSIEEMKTKAQEQIKDYEFKNLLDAVELLFELRAKREKSIKDKKLIKIIEDTLREQPFEYMDEDFILASNKNDSDEVYKYRKRKW